MANTAHTANTNCTGSWATEQKRVTGVEWIHTIRAHAVLKNNQDWIYRVPQKSYQENAAGATVHPLNHQLAAPFATGNLNNLGRACLWKMFVDRFFLRLSGIKHSLVMSNVHWKILPWPTALNFGSDFWLHSVSNLFSNSLIDDPKMPCNTSLWHIT